jgi:hypothetical protein
LAPPPLPSPAAAKAELERRQVEGKADASDDPAFVRYLAAETLSRGQHAAAAACLKRLTALEPADAGAWRQLGTASGRLGQWAAAGEAHAKAGELLIAAARRRGSGTSSSGGDSGGGGMPTAADAGTEFVAGAVSFLNAASSAQAGASGGGSGGGGSSAKLAYVGRALELLHRAQVDCGAAGDAGAWYYTCMARLATGQLPAALDAAAKAWQLRGGGGGGGGGGGEGEAADRLALPLSALCDKLAAQGPAAREGLLRAAELGAEVAAAAGPEARSAAAAALRRVAGAAGAPARLRELADAAAAVAAAAGRP